MGYPTLDAALAFPNNVPPSKSHIVVTDTLQSSANFLIHHFVGNQLKTGGNVILVGLSQIFNHYFFISRKLGINLSTYKQSGQFVFIDGLTHLNEYAHESPYPPANTPTMPTDTLDGSTVKDTDLLKHFHGRVKQHIVGKTRPVLILDDANVLLACGFGLDRVSHLLSRLKVLMEQNDGTLITIVHADESSAEDEEQDAFVRNVLNSAHLVLQVQALNSGLARDVHGELSIIHGPQCVKSNTQPQSLHYRILDNNAEFFAKGYNK